MKKWIRARKRHRITQFELSARSGISRWRIAYAETGYLKLNKEEMKAIRRVLSVAQQEPEELLIPSSGEAISTDAGRSSTSTRLRSASAQGRPWNAKTARSRLAEPFANRTRLGAS
jgi:hypothetical protein